MVWSEVGGSVGFDDDCSGFGDGDSDGGVARVDPACAPSARQGDAVRVSLGEDSSSCGGATFSKLRLVF